MRRATYRAWKCRIGVHRWRHNAQICKDCRVTMLQVVRGTERLRPPLGFPPGSEMARLERIEFVLNRL